MGGGGFMQHGVNTNRRDRAQKAARREKFKGNHSDKTTLNSMNEHEIPQPSSDQITQERERLGHVLQRKKKKDLITFVVAGTITVALLVILYRSLFG